MPTVENLVNETDKFFKMYWNLPNDKPPNWSEHWDFNSTIPNNGKQGCYALFKGQEIIYIGVGIAKGSGLYKGSGLGFRLKRYFMVDKENKSNKKYKPTQNWTELTSLKTIGFDEAHYPLAAALEIYLINQLKPFRNSQHKELGE